MTLSDSDVNSCCLFLSFFLSSYSCSSSIFFFFFLSLFLFVCCCLFCFDFCLFVLFIWLHRQTLCSVWWKQRRVLRVMKIAHARFLSLMTLSWQTWSRICLKWRMVHSHQTHDSVRWWRQSLSVVRQCRIVDRGPWFGQCDIDALQFWTYGQSGQRVTRVDGKPCRTVRIVPDLCLIQSIQIFHE